MKKSIFLWLIAVLLVAIPLVNAVEWSPQGDINLKDRYYILNDPAGNCDSGYVVAGRLANGSWNCTLASSSVGDIIGINTNDDYLLGGCESGTCNLTVNESYLNVTISALDTDTNTWWSIITTYLFNNSGSLDINETKLNATINALDDDTTYDNGTGLDLVGTTFSHEDTSTQASSDNSDRTYIQDIILDGFGHITSIVTAAETVVDTVWTLSNNYLYNNSGTLTLNETKLNATINALDDDTQYTAGDYLSLDGTEFNVVEADLNATIDALDDDTTYSNGSGLDLVGTTFSHEDTSSQSSSDNSGRTYIQDIILDTYGHITSIVTGTESVVDTDTQDLSYNETTNVISLVDGGSINISEVDTDTNTWWSIVTTYLYNNSGSLDINETKLNATIDLLDDDTTYTAGNYLYLSGTEFNVNETTLNATIDSLDDDTTYDNGSGLNLVGTTFSHEDTSSQSSSDNSGRTYIQDIILDTYGHITSIVTGTETVTDTNTWWGLNSGYIYNNSDSLDFNETKLNATIAALDTDTTIGNCSSSGSCSNVAYIDYSNAGDLNVTDGHDICIEGGNCLSEAGTGSGDITSVTTNGDYLYGGSDSGVVNLLLNETKLNLTISALDTDTNTWWSIVTTYLFNNSGSLDINETALNATISALDTNTQLTAEQVTDYAGGMWTGNTESGVDVVFQDGDNTIDVTFDCSDVVGDGLTCDGEDIVVECTDIAGSHITCSDSNINVNDDWWDANADIDADELTEDKINFTTECSAGSHLYISGTNLACETDDDTTYTAGLYLYLDGTEFNLNESELNTTIDALDDDTTYTAGSYLYLDGTEFNVNETTLNATIDAKMGEGDGQGINASDTAYLYDDGSTVSFNETMLNITIEALDSDTTYDNGSGISLDGTTFSHTDTSSQGSSDNSGRTYIQDIILDTYGHITSIVTAAETVVNSFWNISGSNYLYNNSGILEINETALNATIEALDSDTTYTAGSYLYLSSTEFNVNETTLNATIDALDDDTTYANLSEFVDDIGVSSDWDAIGDVPTATPSNGDTTHLSTADQIYDWVIGLAYSAFGASVDDTEMTAEDFGEFTCTGDEDGCTLDTGAYDDEYIELGDSFGGDVSGTYDAISLDCSDVVGTGLTCDGENLILSLTPTVTTLNTGQGAYELYAMNQDVETTDAVTFATVNTGQGANELYDMDQNVLTTSDVQFNNITSIDCITFDSGGKICSGS